MKDKKSSWHDLPLRIISAMVIVPAVIFCVMYGGWFYVVMVACFSFLMTLEWQNLFKFNRNSFKGYVYLFWVPIAYYAAVQGMWFEALFIITGFAFIFGPELWLGSVVIGGAGLSLLWLRFMNGFESMLVLWILGVVIASDSVAYLTGRMIGGPKLLPSVSPGKTWSGAVGGLLGAGIVGALMIGYLNHGLRMAYGVGGVFGIALGIVAQVGDLLESKLKRSLGVKDSGKIIPGHGGVLDRCDALLGVSIFVALLSFVLPAEIAGVKWNGGLLMDSQFMMGKVSILPLFIFK